MSSPKRCGKSFAPKSIASIQSWRAKKEPSPFVFAHPFTCMIAGPTGSGKTVCTIKILQNNTKLINPPPDRIIYCYAENQPSFDELLEVYPPVEFVHGLPDCDNIDPNQNNLIVLDDLMQECKNDEGILKLFTTDSHHKNISVIFIVQNLFSQGKYTRSISLNCHYLILLNNPRDRLQISYLSRQMFPENPKLLIECYEDATNKPHGYLFLDFKQFTPRAYRIQSDIFDRRIFYIPKKSC